MNTFAMMKAFAPAVDEEIVEEVKIEIGRQNLTLCMPRAQREIGGSVNTTNRLRALILKIKRVHLGKLLHKGGESGAGTTMATQPTRAGEAIPLKKVAHDCFQVEKKSKVEERSDDTQGRTVEAKSPSCKREHFSDFGYVLLREFPDEDDASEETMPLLSQETVSDGSLEEGMNAMAQELEHSNQHVMVSSSLLGINEKGDLEKTREPETEKEMVLLSKKRPTRLHRWKNKVTRFLKKPKGIGRLFSRK